MKYALVHDQRSEAEPGLSGLCPVCGAAMVAKCGEVRVWHWAHRGKRQCDRWWETETDWHRNWKDRFPGEWQEVIQTAENGEKHIADVKTGQDWVIEFQHSHIKPEERRSREAFYGDMVWVVDGLRRKRDFKQFMEAVEYGIRISNQPLIVKVHPLDCRFVQEWSISPVPVFFDFGDEIQPHGLWLLIPLELDYTAYFALVGKEDFIGWLRDGVFNPQPFIDRIKAHEQQRAQALRVPNESQQMPMPYIPGKRGHRFKAGRYPARSRRRF